MSGASSVPELTLRNLTIELRKLTNPLKFGVGLGFPPHEMEIIRRDHPYDVDDQKYVVFSKISKNYRSMKITWEKIADVIDEFLNEQDLALELRQKFCRVEKTIDNRIDEIAGKVGIDLRLLDNACDDKHLLPISKLLEHWPSYGPHLGLSPQEVNAIESDEALTGIYMRPLAMLKKWQDKKAYSAEATYRHLLRGCLEINDNAKLVGEICKLLLK